MLMEVKNHFKVIFLSVKYNIMREMTNPVTFASNVIFMILNNACFIIQWIIMFSIKNNIAGYSFQNVMLLWGLSASTFGLARVLFREAFDLSRLIVNGKLDSFLVQPKNVLLSVITSSTSVSAIGDLIYGYIILFIFYPSFYAFLTFTLFTMLGTIITTAVAVIAGSISFWLLRSELLADNINSMIVHFSNYPEGIFDSAIRVLFYTVLPISFIAYLPAQVIFEFNLFVTLGIIGFTILITSLAFLIFNKGLKRYSSSNLMISRI